MTKEACFPCTRRGIKCNTEEPCANCQIIREDCADSKMLGHPDLRRTPGKSIKVQGAGQDSTRLGHSDYPRAVSFFDFRLDIP
jgi:hypothetical protein